jgi:hypothetical protein
MFLRRSVKDICAAGIECAGTAKQLDTKHRTLYAEKLGCGNTAFNMLKRIGEDKRIPKIIKHLPPSISTIYQVSHLSNELLKLGIDREIVSPKATRDDIKDFRGTHKPPTKPATPSEPKQHSAKTNKAQESASSSEQKTSDVHKDPDDFLEDDDDFSEDDQEESEASVEADDAYNAVVGEWLKRGLRRTKWQALPKKLRKSFIEDVLLREPFKAAT